MALVVRETEVKNDVVWQITKKTGLRFNTVRNLMVNGWAYEEPKNKPPRWLGPPTLKE